MTLTHTQEHSLYLSDYTAWCKYIAPRWIEQMKTMTPEQKKVRWNAAPPLLKVAIRDAVNSAENVR